MRSPKKSYKKSGGKKAKKKFTGKKKSLQKIHKNTKKSYKKSGKKSRGKTLKNTKGYPILNSNIRRRILKKTHTELDQASKYIEQLIKDLKLSIDKKRKEGEPATTERQQLRYLVSMLKYIRGGLKLPQNKRLFRAHNI